MIRKKLFILTLFVMTANIAAGPSNLKAEFRKGKTYITFTEEPDSANRYNIYRSTQAISAVDGLIPLAGVAQRSGYDKRFKRFHVIEDLGAPLDSTTGLFVYTPKVNGPFYYAVTVVNNGVENKLVTAGINAMLQPVNEEYWEWPMAVLRDIENIWGNLHFHYFFWQDYFDWNHDMDYYGNYFDLGRKNGMKDTVNAPIQVFLHGCCTDLYAVPKAPVLSNAYVLALQDHPIDYWFPRNPYWYGVSNNYKNKDNNGGAEYVAKPGDTIVNYTQMQIMNALHSILQDSRFSIDTNRIYIAGQSMGGFGTKMTAFHNPGIFAACFPQIGHNIPEYPRWTNIYGKWESNVTARNGTKIYYWCSLPWQSETFPEKDFPPLINGHGLIDGHNIMWTHTITIKTFAKNRHAIWDKWHPGGHSAANITEINQFRFKRNELYPAFTNSTADDNYGKDIIDPLTPYNCYNGAEVLNVDSFTKAVDSEGVVNLYLDWTSSLHDADSSNNNDALVDSFDSLAVFFISHRPNTRVDITPRRIQRFPVVAGHSYYWRNIAVATGLTVDSGVIAPDPHGLLTVEQFAVSETGNRLVMTHDNGVVREALRFTEGKKVISTYPNPFNPSVSITLNGINTLQRGDMPQITILDIHGRIISVLTAKNGSVVWNASGQSSGLYVVRVLADGKTYERKIALVK